MASGLRYVLPTLSSAWGPTEGNSMSSSPPNPHRGNKWDLCSWEAPFSFQPWEPPANFGDDTTERFCVVPSRTPSNLPCSRPRGPPERRGERYQTLVGRTYGPRGMGETPVKLRVVKGLRPNLGRGFEVPTQRLPGGRKWPAFGASKSLHISSLEGENDPHSGLSPKTSRDCFEGTRSLKSQTPGGRPFFIPWVFDGPDPCDVDLPAPQVKGYMSTPCYGVACSWSTETGQARLPPDVKEKVDELYHFVKSKTTTNTDLGFHVCVAGDYMIEHSPYVSAAQLSSGTYLPSVQGGRGPP